MSLSVNNLNSALLGSSIGADSLTGAASANRLTNQIQDAGTDEEMMSACEQFETYVSVHGKDGEGI